MIVLESKTAQLEVLCRSNERYKKNENANECPIKIVSKNILSCTLKLLKWKCGEFDEFWPTKEAVICINLFLQQ
jgi:hypothetical protein